MRVVWRDTPDEEVSLQAKDRSRQRRGQVCERKRLRLAKVSSACFEEKSESATHAVQEEVVVKIHCDLRGGRNVGELRLDGEAVGVGGMSKGSKGQSRRPDAPVERGRHALQPRSSLYLVPCTARLEDLRVRMDQKTRGLSGRAEAWFGEFDARQVEPLWYLGRSD